MATETPFSGSASSRQFTAADYARGLRCLVGAVQELSMARCLPEVQRIVRSAARALTGCDGATFVLRENGNCYYADEDAITPLWKGSRFPIEACISGWTMVNKDAAIIPNIYLDPRIPHEAYRPTFVKSLVMVPIRRLDPIGAIGNYWSYERQPSEHEVELLQSLADSTSMAMENVAVHAELEERVRNRTAELEKANKEIHKLSVSDELTGLLNRRGFYLQAESALALARRNKRGGILAFLDVDGLKEVNDAHGHETGDKVISDIAAVLRRTLRKSDIVARMGGDEFCILACESEGDATVLKKRILEAFETFTDINDRPYRLSASIGLLRLRPDDTAPLDVLVDRADKLMYLEKQDSRSSGTS